MARVSCLQDSVHGTSYFSSDALTDADYWKSVSGDFTTGPDTKLLLLRVQRFPAGSPIKGKLWIDGIRLNRQETASQGQTLEISSGSHSFDYPAADSSPSRSIFAAVVFYGAISLLLFGPLAFGAVEPWSTFVLEVGSAVLFVVWTIWQATSKKCESWGAPCFFPCCHSPR